VPGRSYILLHEGNFSGDKEIGLRTHSAGCVLLGRKRGRLYGQNAVLSSRTARREFEVRMNWQTTELEVVGC
jgi:hypothetical protein